MSVQALACPQLGDHNIPTAGRRREGTTTRRSLVAKIVGIEDRPQPTQKFNEAGWFAFSAIGAGCKIVQYCARDGKDFIALSDGPEEATRFYLSNRAFDELCWGVVRAEA